jgi:hypothetical protein
MLWTENPKRMAEQVRAGTLKRIDIVATLDEPASGNRHINPKTFMGTFLNTMGAL